MSPQHSISFTALVLVAQSLQATPTAMSTLSEPAIEMVHQAAERKEQPSESISRSSSMARFCLRRSRTTSSTTSRMSEEITSSTDDLDDRSTHESTTDVDSDSSESSSDLYINYSYRGRKVERTPVQPELKRVRSKLSRRRDPRDFMKTGMPDRQHGEEHHHKHHRFQHQHQPSW